MALSDNKIIEETEVTHKLSSTCNTLEKGYPFPSCRFLTDSGFFQTLAPFQNQMSYFTAYSAFYPSKMVYSCFPEGSGFCTSGRNAETEQKHSILVSLRAALCFSLCSININMCSFYKFGS